MDIDITSKEREHMMNVLTGLISNRDGIIAAIRTATDPGFKQGMIDQIDDKIAGGVENLQELIKQDTLQIRVIIAALGLGIDELPTPPMRELFVLSDVSISVSDHNPQETADFIQEMYNPPEHNE